MDQGMTDSGKMVWPMVMEDWFMQKEMSMKANGKMTRLMDMEFIPISTAADMKVNGTKINNMDWDQNSGLMEPNTKEITNKA